MPLQDKSQLHKLLQVLVPRYQDYTKCYTSMFYAPTPILSFEEHGMPHLLKPLKKPKKGQTRLVCIELKGHPYPPLAYSNTKPNKKSIQNVLLIEAKRDLENLKLE